METVTVETALPSVTSLVENYGLLPEKCDQQISDVHLEEISRCGCKDWKSLSPHMEMESILVDDICRHSQMSEREKRHDFFLQWRDLKGSEATYRKLISALLKIKSRNDAEMVCKLLQEASKCKPTSQPQSSTKQFRNGSSLDSTGMQPA